MDAKFLAKIRFGKHCINGATGAGAVAAGCSGIDPRCFNVVHYCHYSNLYHYSRSLETCSVFFSLPRHLFLASLPYNPNDYHWKASDKKERSAAFEDMFSVKKRLLIREKTFYVIQSMRVVFNHFFPTDCKLQNIVCVFATLRMQIPSYIPL